MKLPASQSVIFSTKSLAETFNAGIEISLMLVKPISTVALIGDLGAGKTELARGIIAGVGRDPALVVSPTYTIAVDYPGDPHITHIDLYRITSTADLESIDFYDILSDDGIVIIEWADRFIDELIKPYLKVTIDFDPKRPTCREISVENIV